MRTKFPRRPALLVPALALAFLTACAASRQESRASEAPGKPAAQAEQHAPPAPAAKTAVFAPANAAAWSYWPEEWAGQLLVLEVLPHGATVKEGDVLARFDTRPIDDQIRAARLELASAQVRHAGLVEKNRLEEEAARSALANAQASLDRAKRALAGWKEQDLAFARRDDELAQRREAAYLEDQRDELGQLEEMYKKDELVDGTEEIVLKRQRRQVALVESGNALSRDRAKKRFDLDQALELEQREESVRTQAEALERLKRSQEVDRASRGDGERRSAEALADLEAKVARLDRDRAALVAKASRAGVFVHGPVRDWRPGRTPPRHERGASLAPRTELGAVADPAPAELRLDLAGADLATWKDGAKVRVKLTGGKALEGALRVDAWPRGDGVYEATVTLAAPAEGVPVGARAEVELAP